MSLGSEKVGGLAGVEDYRRAQAATNEILRVISTAAIDPQPVFDLIAESATKLCGAEVCTVTQFDGEWVRIGSIHGSNAAGIEALRKTFPMRPSGASGATRAIHDRAIVHIPDVRADPHYKIQDVALSAGFRALLAVPMLQEGRAIGAITVGRTNAGLFSDMQVQLLGTFATQALIAIENTRLLNQLRQRTDDLARSVEELHALGDVTRAVNSTLDLQTVLDTIVARATQLSHTEAGAIYVFDEASREFRLRATYGMDDAITAAIRDRHIKLGETAIGRAAQQRMPIQIPDIHNDPSSVLDVIVRAGFRALLTVSLLGVDRIVGALVVRRKEPGAFAKSTWLHRADPR